MLDNKSYHGVNQELNIRDTIKNFGNRLAYMRTKRGMSQAELAQLIGKSQSTIVYYEAGKIKSLPDDETMAKIAEVFETKVEALLADNELSLDRFNPAVAQWLMSEESTAYIRKAFIEWATDKANDK